MDTLTETKAGIRSALIDRRTRLPAQEAEDASGAIGRSLLQHAALGSARQVGLYSPIRGEVSTQESFEQLRRRAIQLHFPRVAADGKGLEFVRIDHWDQLTQGYQGILEPDSTLPSCSASDLEVLVIPGVAFDVSGRRLGWGKGFYDRLLRGFSGTRIGIAYDFQILERLPEGPHDERVNVVISEKRVITI